MSIAVAGLDIDRPMNRSNCTSVEFRRQRQCVAGERGQIRVTPSKLETSMVDARALMSRQGGRGPRLLELL